MGGADAVLEKARATFEAGDLRWTATVAEGDTAVLGTCSGSSTASTTRSPW